jgi:hypothetical protein
MSAAASGVAGIAATAVAMTTAITANTDRLISTGFSRSPRHPPVVERRTIGELWDDSIGVRRYSFMAVGRQPSARPDGDPTHHPQGRQARSARHQ